MVFYASPSGIGKVQVGGAGGGGGGGRQERRMDQLEKGEVEEKGTGWGGVEVGRVC